MDPRGSAPRIWLIAGPTASGKSALALRLAQSAGGEVINADSMQLYADLRVLTARPGPAEEAAVPHHLFGVADAADAWSVGRWLRVALPVIQDVLARQRLAVIVGGTGLYFSALTRGLADQPPVSPEARRKAEAQFERIGEGEFRRQLSEFDPEGVARIAPRDRQRLVRLHELMTAGGAPSGARRSQTTPALAPGTWRSVVLEPPREALYRRIEARLAVMAAAGALEETRALLARSLASSLPAMKALGVREFAEALDGRASLAEAVALAAQATRRYAKRQLTWFRNQTADWPRIEASEPEDQWPCFERLRAGL